MLTEQQAREKWCPAARVVLEGERERTPPFNRLATTVSVVDANPVDARCIASGCMWWRWERRWQPREHDGPTEVQTERGYCGMAGKP